MTEKINGLPVIDVDESEKITVAVRADDLLEGDTADPERHPIAIALRRQDDVELQIAITPHSVVAKRTADRTAKIDDAISEANDSPDHDCDCQHASKK